MDYLEYKGFKGSVEYSKEDNCLCGKVQGMSKDLIAYEGQTLDELRRDFEDGIDSYLSDIKPFQDIRKMAETGELPDLTLEEINEEIRLARKERKKKLQQD